jgi:hypothetical protein
LRLKRGEDGRQKASLNSHPVETLNGTSSDEILTAEILTKGQKLVSAFRELELGIGPWSIQKKKI